MLAGMHNVISGEIDQAVLEKKTLIYYEIVCMPRSKGQLTLGHRLLIVTERVCFFVHTLNVSVIGR